MGPQDALIGYTGFAGSNILSKRPFGLLYNSKNIEKIKNQQLGLVVCAGAPGTKWVANQNPQADLANLQKLMDNLATINCKQLVLISTIDVYPQPLKGCNEDFKIDDSLITRYGQHRHLLEEFAIKNFDTLVIRLPGVFGTGLKKNVIFDLMHKAKIKLKPDSLLQFYWLERLWSDIEKALAANLASLNIATEPIMLKDIAKEVFNISLPDEGSAAYYDMHTKHSGLWGKNLPYLYDRSESIQDLKQFVSL